MEFKWLSEKIAEETTEIILAFNEKGEIIYANGTAVRLLKYNDEEELKKCSMSAIFRKEFENDGAESAGAAAFDVNKLLELKETAVYMKTKMCIPVNIRIFPAQTDGEYLLFAEDITSQKDMYERIQKLKEREEINRTTRNSFTANVTHELRTPVNGIKGHVMSLLDMVGDVEQRKILDIILYCCNNMSAIISNILDFSKLEAGKFTLDEQKFDFYKMMDKTIATHMAEINKKELRLSVDVDEEIPQFLIGDELRLSQILNNLISNAIKFTSVGYVNIVVNKTRQVSDEVELFFMVRDSGIGISEKEKDRLFKSFSQVDPSITRRFGGTGLGLSIVKQLVELMHGDIYVESESGKGSTFSFFVKLHSDKNVDESEKQSAAYKDWSSFANSDSKDKVEEVFVFGEPENKEEIKKRMNKLVLSIEMGAWDKAETLSETIKSLTAQGGDDIKKLVFRMEMAIRKSNYEKSIEMYEKVKQELEKLIGEL